MKNHLLIVLPVLLVMGSCQRASIDDEQAAQAEEKAAVQAAADALEIERARVREERDALAAEREELQLRREAEMAAKAEDLIERELELAFQREEAQKAADALAAEKAEFANFQQELNESEMLQAGTTAISDWMVDEPEVMQEPVADFSLFYDELESHGSWFETPQYGFVFQPTVVIRNHSWRPYLYGRWVCSNLGWTWRSDEPFGWATFHYGRWVMLSGRGWCWVPGSEWAPSWCAWREGEGHVGWAPLPPETLAYRGRSWGSDVCVDLGISYSSYVFVESRYMAEPLSAHCLPVRRNQHHFGNTRGCTKIQYHHQRIICGGPSYAKLSKVVRRPWPVCHLDLDLLGGFGKGRDARNLRQGVRRGDRLRVFAPSLETPWNSSLRPKRVAGSWSRVEAVRAESGIKEIWKDRLASARDRQNEKAKDWTRKNEETGKARTRQLGDNRRKVAVAQVEMREKLDRRVRASEIGGRASAMEQRSREEVEKGAQVARPRSMAARPPQRTASRGSSIGRHSELPTGVTRSTDAEEALARISSSKASRTASESSSRSAGIRKRQEEARTQVAAREREASSGRRPSGTGVSVGDDRFTEMNRRLTQARERSEMSARLAQSQRESQERIRRQQESNRVAQQRAVQEESRRDLQLQQQAERSRQEEQRRQQVERDRVREAQEQARQAQQQAKLRAAREQEQRAQAERARQQAEQARAKEAANRRAAERASAQRAQEQRARQQAESARRQQEAQREAQERARQQQDQARRQRGNQERIREALEKRRQVEKESRRR